MKAAPSELEIRRAAAQATLDRFRGHPFEWGKWECGKMLAFHLKAIGRPVKLQKLGTYRTAIGARAALRRLGYEDLGSLMCDHSPLLDSPAHARIGDVLELKQEEGAPLGAIGIYLGNRIVLGYHQDFPGAEPMRLQGEDSVPLRGWRVR